jgi:hypothetical protein
VGAVSARSDLATVTEHAERAIDGLFAPLAPRMRAIVERHAVDGTLTHAARLAILRETDVLLDALYGPVRGSPSRLGSVVVDHAVVALATPLVREGGNVVRRLEDEPALLAAMEEG